MEPIDLLVQYRQIVQSRLGALTDHLVSELAVIAQAQQPDETYLLNFEVHSDGFAEGFPVYWDPMSAELDQLDGRTDLLSELTYTLPNEVVNEGIYSESGINPWDIVFQMLVVWFGECWHEAGGIKCDYPAYICHHDDIESYDLRLLKWISDDEKWPS